MQNDGFENVGVENDVLDIKDWNVQDCKDAGIENGVFATYRLKFVSKCGKLCTV